MPYFNIILSLVALVLSIVGLAKKNTAGKAKAIAGLSLAVISLAAGVFFISKFNDFVVDTFEEVISSGLGNYQYSEPDNYYYVEGDFMTTDGGYSSGVL